MMFDENNAVKSCMKTKRITKKDFHGVWAALPTPWKRDGKLDHKIFTHDIARCCKAGVHGVYSGGTTGEFYTQDFDLFVEINEVMIETAHRHGTPMQAGCTALDTAQACKRIRRACQLGADIIQIALPFWLEMDDQETLDFFETIADTAGSTPIVHYDTGRSKRRISSPLYRRILSRVPTLWGTKFGGSDVYVVKQITQLNPDLRVFIGEHVLASATPLGATGAYSSLVTINPAWMLEYYEACRMRSWGRAFEIQNEVNTLFAAFDEVLVSPNLQDTAIDRILGQLAGFLKCPLEAKPPYRHGTREDLKRLRAWMKKHLPHVMKIEK